MKNSNRILFALCLGVSTPAFAEEAVDPEAVAEAVEEAERKGFEALGSQDWGTALFQFSQVLGYRPERTYLLYYSAVASRQNGDIENARRFGLKARSATPPLKDELAQKNEALLAEIAKLEAEQAAKRAEELETRKLQRQISSDVRPRASGWTWVGVGALALGGVSLGGAVWQSNKLVDVREEMKVPQTRPEYDALRETADGHQTLGQVFFVSGVVLAATGVGIIVWDLMTPEDEAAEDSAPTQTSLGVTPTGAFVRVSW